MVKPWVMELLPLPLVLVHLLVVVAHPATRRHRVQAPQQNVVVAVPKMASKRSWLVLHPFQLVRVAQLVRLVLAMLLPPKVIAVALPVLGRGPRARQLEPPEHLQ